MGLKEGWKKFSDFLKEDSWSSFIVSLILAFIFIKFIFFPVLSGITGTPLPLVIVESCSMYHSQNLEQIMENKLYSDRGIYFNDTKDWTFKNGFNKGDIMFVIGAKKVNVGDVIVFDGGQANSIIHRVISIDNQKYTTKGDNNFGLLSFEQGISSERVLGKAVFRLPYVGWIKLIFFDIFKNPSERGFCR